MAEGDDRPETDPGEKHVFDQPATIREPAAPRVPRAQQAASVPVIPLPGEEQAHAAEAPSGTLQEAREATDALLRDILEEDVDGEVEPRRADAPASGAREEDWPAELHSLHLPEES